MLILLNFIDTVKFEVETYTEAYSDSTYAGIFISKESGKPLPLGRGECQERAEFERLSKS